jgi:hypothetical protein
LFATHTVSSFLFSFKLGKALPSFALDTSARLSRFASDENALLGIDVRDVDWIVMEERFAAEKTVDGIVPTDQ